MKIRTLKSDKSLAKKNDFSPLSNFAEIETDPAYVGEIPFVINVDQFENQFGKLKNKIKIRLSNDKRKIANCTSNW